jgi:hypothetical protein
MPDGPQALGSSRIERVLASRGLLSSAVLERARRLEAESGDRIDRVAAKLSLVSERDPATAYAELTGSPVVSATEFPIEPSPVCGAFGYGLRALLKNGKRLAAINVDWLTGRVRRDD